jgi:hypothetical protein
MTNQQEYAEQMGNTGSVSQEDSGTNYSAPAPQVAPNRQDDQPEENTEEASDFTIRDRL